MLVNSYRVLFLISFIPPSFAGSTGGYLQNTPNGVIIDRMLFQRRFNDLINTIRLKNEQRVQKTIVIYYLIDMIA